MVAICDSGIAPPGENDEPGLTAVEIRDAAAALAATARAQQLVVTYGIARHLELLVEAGPPSGREPQLDVLNAELAGAVGYPLVQALRNELPTDGVVFMITEVRVDAGDPEFLRPTLPLGPIYYGSQAHLLAAHWRWLFQPAGGGWRRVVPRPQPRAVVEAHTISTLLDAGLVVVCGGGGGIPVVSLPDGDLRGVAAVVSHELSAAVLAAQIGATRLVLLQVAPPALGGHRGTRRLAVADARRSWAGSAVPEILLAASHFVEATGAVATVGRLAEAASVLTGEAGLSLVAAVPAGADGGRSREAKGQPDSVA